MTDSAPASSKQIRIIGLAAEPVEDFRTRQTRNSGFFAALDRRYSLLGVLRPQIPSLPGALNTARRFHPRRDAWRHRTNLNAWRFHQRTALAEQELGRRRGEYDLVMELQTVMAPARNPARFPFAIYTDNTYTLTQRHYPAWSPLGAREGQRWIELERATFQAARVVFTKSEFTRRAVIEDYGCDPDRVVPAGGGANIVADSLSDKVYDACAALFVGFDFTRKGGRTLLQAWETVHRRLPDARLWLVGPRRSHAPALGGVVWLGRIADRRALIELYRQATVFVMPSMFEPWGLVFLEAMGMGLPCIGARCCAMPEIIEDGTTGFLVAPGEPEPLADALTALLRDPARAEAMGRRAHETAMRRWTWDQVVGRIAPHIEATVGEPGSPTSPRPGRMTLPSRDQRVASHTPAPRPHEHGEAG